MKKSFRESWSRRSLGPQRHRLPAFGQKDAQMARGLVVVNEQRVLHPQP